MDADYLARFRERQAYETDRSTPPPRLSRASAGAARPLHRPRVLRIGTRPAVPPVVAVRRARQRVRRRRQLQAGGHPRRRRAARPRAGPSGAGLLQRLPAPRHARGERRLRHTARMLVCQYHSWGYDLDGTLQRVPDERDFPGLDKGALGLPPVRCENWGGWWFVNLDAAAVPLQEWLDPVPPAVGHRRLADAVVDKSSLSWPATGRSWRKASSRCPPRTIHPTTVAPTLDTRGTVISLFDHGHQNMLSPVKEGAPAATTRDAAHPRPCARPCSTR